MRVGGRGGRGGESMKPWQKWQEYEFIEWKAKQPTASKLDVSVFILWSAVEHKKNNEERKRKYE